MDISQRSKMAAEDICSMFDIDNIEEVNNMILKHVQPANFSIISADEKGLELSCPLCMGSFDVSDSEKKSPSCPTCGFFYKS